MFCLLLAFSHALGHHMTGMDNMVLCLQVMLAGEQLDEALRMGVIADRTDGYSGSDLRHLCTAAAMRPLRELLATSGKAGRSKSQVGSPGTIWPTYLSGSCWNFF